MNDKFKVSSMKFTYDEILDRFKKSFLSVIRCDCG